MPKKSSTPPKSKSPQLGLVGVVFKLGKKNKFKVLGSDLSQVTLKSLTTTCGVDWTGDIIDRDTNGKWIKIEGTPVKLGTSKSKKQLDVPGDLTITVLPAGPTSSVTITSVTYE